MKIKYIIIIFTIIILIIALSLLKTIKVERKLGHIKHFRFEYSTGYAINENNFYELNCNIKKCEVIIKPNKVSEDNQLKMDVDRKIITSIKKVLEEYNVANWNGYNKTDKNILDGNSFSLYIIFDDQSTLSASGYMRWPKNYQQVKQELDKIFMDIYNKNNTK